MDAATPPKRALDILRASTPTISVGILTADLMNLGSELALLEGTGIRAIHIDVMDGCFVPFMTVGPPFIQGLRTRFLKDVHLMIQNPAATIREYVLAGADIITVHVEACEDARPVLKELGSLENANDPERGLVRGVALNPDTPLELLLPLLDHVELISVLAVNPRIKGFPFLDSIADRFAMVKDMVVSAGRDTLLCLDGGVKRSSIAAMARTGADLFVSGSAIFDGTDPGENARFMIEAVRSHHRQGVS
jgi:ribulose-phosphate 3-epimerase